MVGYVAGIFSRDIVNGEQIGNPCNSARMS